MKVIYFYISNNNHHWQMMRPVMEAVKRSGVAEPVLLSLCEFRRMTTPQQELKILGINVRILAGLKFKGSSTSSGSKTIGGNKALIRNLLRQLIWWFRLLPSLREANQKRPALVVVPNDTAYPFDRICRWYRNQGIAFVLFQEGIRFPLPNEEGGIAYGTNGAKEIWAWGETSANYFKDLRLSNTRVVATGNPRFDALLKKDYSAEKEKLAEIVNPDKAIVLYVSNPIDDQGFCSHAQKMELFLKFLTALAPLFKEGSLTLLVRLHPREDPSYFIEIIRQLEVEKEVLWVQNFSLFACLQQADLTVVLASTVGLESMLCNTPVAVLKLPNYGFVHDYVSSGCATGIDLDNGALVEQLRELLNRDKQDEIWKCKKYIATQLSNQSHSITAIAQRIPELLID